MVDGYSLAFAALVLTGGSIGDRFGRRPVLLVGLLGFAVSSALGGVFHEATALVAIRFVMGTFAALIYPTTLSIITNAYPDRKQRAKAIGVWGAVTGLGVAVGPVSGGLLLAHFWYGSVFLALVPVAIIAAAATAFTVPESSEPAAARFDLGGLLASSAAIGFSSTRSSKRRSTDGDRCAASADSPITAALSVVFVMIERRTREPDDRRVAVQGARVLGGERSGDGHVLRPLRIHLPDHPVHAVHPPLRHPLDRREDPSGGGEHRCRISRRRRALAEVRDSVRSS